MDEFLKKLSETGIKTLDLLNRGIDKLPDGLEAMLNALEFKYLIIGRIWLVFGFVMLAILVGVWVWVLKTRWLIVVGRYSWSDGREEISAERGSFMLFFSAITGMGVALTMCNFNVWFMALDPRGYILMCVAERLLMLGGK